MAVEVGAEQDTRFDPEVLRRERAPLLVLHNAFQALWEAPQGKRTQELATVEGRPLFLGLVRHTLSNCEHLVLQGRFWNFRWRQTAATAPLGGLVTTLLTLRGAPMGLDEIVALLAPWRSSPSELLEEMVCSFLLSRIGQVCFSVGEKFGLMAWLPPVNEMSLTDAFEQEFWQREAFGEWLLSLTPVTSDLLADAVQLLDNAAMPLSYREVLFALWAKREGRMDFQAAFAQLSQAETLQLLSLGYWVSAHGKRKTLEVLSHLSEEWEQRALQKARHLDIRRLLQTPPSPKEPSVQLGKEIADEIAHWLKTQPKPVPLTQIAEQVLEVLPTDREYASFLRALVTLLHGDERFVEMGRYHWWLRTKTPEEVHEIPAALLPPPPPPVPQDLSQPADVLLPLDGLDEDLRRFVEDPLYEEVGEPEAVVPKDLKPPKRLDIPVLFPHLLAGTLKIRRIDMPFFPPEPPLQFLSVIDDTHAEFGLWVNLSLGLCFGLTEWYQRRGVGVGGIVRLEEQKSGLVRLSWTNRYDRWLQIPPLRLEELRQFATHETIRQAPLFVLVQALLTQYPKGVHFLRLWSELNVLRRTTKRALASLLCAYPMFVRVPNAEGFWTLDFSKMSEGIRPEKLAYLRPEEG